MPKQPAPDPKRNVVRRFFSVLGPGLITGAADDDPSGVATYSIAGAQMGTSLLWTAFITWPLQSAVFFMCARIGMVTGKGLAGAVREKFPRWVLVVFAFALFAANTKRSSGTAIINGLLAPFLLVGILIAASDRGLMQNEASSWWSRLVVGITIFVMFGAGVAMFVL